MAGSFIIVHGMSYKFIFVIYFLYLMKYSSNSTYILQGMSSDRIKLIDSLVQFILLQRDMEQGHFYDNSQFHSVVGFTSCLIEDSACDYVSHLQEQCNSI